VQEGESRDPPSDDADGNQAASKIRTKTFQKSKKSGKERRTEKTGKRGAVGDPVPQVRKGIAPRSDPILLQTKRKKSWGGGKEEKKTN